MDQLSYIEEYNELMNDHYRSKLEDKERINANDKVVVAFDYRFNPSISRRLGFRV
jgi:hypothetical protein